MNYIISHLNKYICKNKFTGGYLRWSYNDTFNIYEADKFELPLKRLFGLNAMINNINDYNCITIKDELISLRKNKLKKINEL